MGKKSGDMERAGICTQVQWLRSQRDSAAAKLSTPGVWGLNPMQGSPTQSNKDRKRTPQSIWG